MATTAEIRQQIFNFLYSDQTMERPRNGYLATALDDGADQTTTVASAKALGIVLNSIIEFADGDQALVTAIATDTDLTLERGLNTTTAAAHSSGDRFYVDPRFTIAMVDDAVDKVLATLEGHGIHAWGTGSITRSDTSQDHWSITETDLANPEGEGSILSVYYVRPTQEYPLPLPYREYQQLSTTPAEWANAAGIHILAWGEVALNDLVYYTYAKLIDAVGDLLPRQEQIVMEGALWQLARATTIPRTQDPGRYTDRTVQAGQGNRDSQDFGGAFFLMTRAESAQLAVERDALPSAMADRRARRWTW